MKLISYIIRPIVILLFLSVMALIIYFRSVIFLPYINNNVDEAQSYIENKLDISIPVYIVEPVVIKNKLVSNEVKIEPLFVEEKNDSSMEKALISESIEAENISDDNKLKKVLDNKNDDSVVYEAEIEDTDSSITTNLLEKLTYAVSELNTKVDVLFNETKESASYVFIENNTSENKSNHGNTASAVDIETKKQSIEKAESIVTNSTIDIQKMINTARQTYWSGDMQNAEKMYLHLAGMEDANPDIYGELGNVYYSQGKWKESGKAYYEAAVRLIALNKNKQIPYLMRVIQGLDAESAEKLKQKISG
ncbi:MAG: hypothetical protein QM504_06000 [Pseudomonadota bacterium]